MGGHSVKNRFWFFFAILLALLLTVWALWLTYPAKTGLVLRPVTWASLSLVETDQDDLREAYLRSCARLQSLAPDDAMPLGPITLKRRAWQEACTAVETSDAPFHTALKRAYRPFILYQGRRKAGHFTGYYVPLLHGSLKPSPKYPIPLYQRPPELVDVDLGAFRENLKGQRLAGKVEGNRLIPYADRAAIDAGALNERGLELLWVSSAIDAFFLHIQGSGHVKLEDGTVLRVGYDGQNGHPYYAIGRTLIIEGAVKREDMSLDAITQWLKTHPERADALMQENASYIFFRLLDGDGVIGAQGVPLTPKRSLAVDPTIIALGVPVWISTQRSDGARFRRVMIAQDTGGAIKGAGRGDIFFGPGEEAKRAAGALNAKGTMVVLLPVTAVAP